MWLRILLILMLFTSAASAQIVDARSFQTISNKTGKAWVQLGLGTNAPQATLHVLGTTLFESTTAENANIHLYDTAGGYYAFKIPTVTTNTALTLPTFPDNGILTFSLSQGTNLVGVIKPWELPIDVGDETTTITTGTKKTFRAPRAMTILAIRASLTTASSSGTPTYDINEGGSSIFSTRITIDQGEKTSTTAAAAAVFSDTTIADDAEITIDVDTSGTGTAGLKFIIYYY